MNSDLLLSSAVRMAFIGGVLHQMGVHQPGVWDRTVALPWATIALACISLAALYSAFAEVVNVVAKTTVWLIAVLGSVAMLLASMFLFAVVQWGPKERSDEIVAMMQTALARLVV